MPETALAIEVGTHVARRERTITGKYQGAPTNSTYRVVTAGPKQVTLEHTAGIWSGDRIRMAREHLRSPEWIILPSA